MTDEQLVAWRAVGEALGRAFASSPAPPIGLGPDGSIMRAVNVMEGDSINFGGPELVEVDRLLRIIGNSAQSADRITRYIAQQGKILGEPQIPLRPNVPRSAAMRYAVTMRDSLKLLVELMGGDFERLTPDWVNEDEDVSSTEVNIGDDTVVIYYSDSSAEELASRLANVYVAVKSLKPKIISSAIDYNDIDAILKQIKEG